MAKKKILTENGQEILPITHESCVLDNNGVSIGSKIGNINELATDSRTDLVSAINDILYFNNETKQQLIDILISKGVDCSNDKTFNEILGILASKEFDLSEIKQIACGHSHMFILKTDGSIWGCGKNEFGQLGLNDSDNRNVFTKVTENINNDVTQVYCGQSHSFIVKNDGTIWSCGGNSYGELGNGDNTEDVFKFTQIEVNLTSPVKQIACGHLHTMLLTEDGNVYACGYALNGRLGLGVNDESIYTTFTQVTDITDVKQIFCTPISSIMLKNDGTVWACGKNEKGHLGLGDTTDRDVFTQITSITNAKQIACGYSHTVVLKNDGTVWACGNNNYGQLGIGSSDENNNSTFVQINSDVKEISCGYSHTFVIKNDDILWGCGWNDVGQLGLGYKSNVLSFVKIESIINTIKMISCGRKYTAMVLDNGKLYITGDNNSGQLGLGDTNDRMDFMNVFVKQDEINAMQYITAIGFVLRDIKQVVCGANHTFILKTDGSLWACGENNYGQLGLGNTTDQSSFTQVTTNVNSDVKQVACGGNHTFILKNDGSVWSCGYNSYGQLGLGTSGSSANKTTFTQVTTNISDVKEIVCGSCETFIIKNDGSLWGCGCNGYGSLGINSTTHKSTFTQVTTNINNDVKQVACTTINDGYDHTVILKNDGSVWSCGYNNSGQLGLGDTTQRTTFTQVTTNINNDVKQISCGSYHTFILKNDGSIWSCGANSSGQLGLGNTTTYKSFTKVTTNINNDVKQIVCGGIHTFIIKTDGSIWACGENNYGQLGINDTTDRNTFTQVTSNNHSSSVISCGNSHTFVLENNDGLWVCGYSNSGQLGLGDNSNHLAFVYNKLTSI